MNALPIVVRAEHRGDFRIRLVFSDGVEGTIDFSEWLTGPVFQPLKDREYFARSSWKAARSPGRTVPTSRLRHCTRASQGQRRQHNMPIKLSSRPVTQILRSHAARRPGPQLIADVRRRRKHWGLASAREQWLPWGSFCRSRSAF